MTEHTPTPWELRYSEAREWSPEPKPERILGPSGDPVWVACIGMSGSDESVANAAFIVKAVNNHDDLVKALRFYASEWQPNGEGDPETPGLSRSWVEPTDELQNDGGRKAREALAQVKP